MTTVTNRFKVSTSRYGEKFPDIEGPQDIYAPLTLEDLQTIWCDTNYSALNCSWDGKRLVRQLTDDGSMSIYRYTDEAAYVQRVNDRIEEWRQSDHPEYVSIHEIISDYTDESESFDGLWG